MNRIEYQVRAARRRLILGRFGCALCVTLFAALIAATVAVAAPAIWVMEVDFNSWSQSWIVGSVVAALLAALAYALATAPSEVEVAQEVDRRFGLRERLSSSLTLDDRERDSDFGLALTADAEKRAAQLEIADRFTLKPSRLGWLPISLVPVLAIVLLLVEPARESNASSTSKADIEEINQVKKVAEQLKRRIQQQKRTADSKGLKEAKELFEKMEADLDKLASRKEMDRKEAMIAMNDLKKQLEERRGQLGSADQMRKMMSQLKGLEAGPADKVSKSIAKGNFGQARDMVKQLANQMRDGKLSEQQKEQLKKQIEQLKEQMKKAAERHEQQKRDLQRQIEQARREGRGQDAAKLQQQLNQLMQKDSQMQQMQQMAEGLSQAAQAMQQGDGSKAADALDQLSDQLGQMAEEMAELEDLETALDQLSQSKSGMGQGQGMGDGLGRGQGAGDRPENENETNTYETQVRGKPKGGRAIIAGRADGPNRKGITREDLKHAIQSSLSEESDPLENQQLPRAEREHTQSYFDRLRDGE